MSPFCQRQAHHLAVLLPRDRRWLDPLDWAVIEARAWLLAARDFHGADYRPDPADLWRILCHRAGIRVRLDPRLRHYLPHDLRTLLFP